MSDDLTYQCALCGDTIDERPGDPRIDVCAFRPGLDSTQTLFFHRSCLTSVLHKSVPLGELFEAD